MADLIELDLVVREKGLKQSLTTVERLERQLTKAAKAIDSNRISQERYNKVLLSAKREYQTLGLSSQKATSQVRQFAAAQREANVAATDFGNSIGFGGKKINRMGVGLQQAGYQIGDFAVQLQGGTNAAVALGQQGSQLLGIFGPAGAIAGAALAIGTAFVAPLIQAREKAEELNASLGDIITTLQDLEEATNGVQRLPAYLEEFARSAKMQGFKDLRESAKASFVDILGGFKSIRRAATGIGQDAKDNIKTLLDAQGENRTLLSEVLGGGLAEQEARYKASRGIVMEMNAEIAKIEDSFNADNVGEFATQVIKLRNYLVESGFGSSQAVKNLDQMILQQGLFNVAAEYATEQAEASAKAAEDHAEKIANLRDLMREISSEATVVTEETVALAEGFGLSVEQIIALQKALDGGKVTAEQLGAVDIDAAISPAVASARELAEQLGVSLQTSLAMLGLVERAGPVLDPRNPAYDADEARLQRLKDMIESGELYNSTLEKTTTTTKKLGNTTKEVMTEAEKAAQAYADALDNTVVSAVGSVSDAWADFVMRGFKDFKGFVGSVLDSFKNMIAQMIAMAAKNRIMLSLGIGGVAPTAAMAGSGLLGGAGLLGGGGAGIGAAMSGVGSGVSGIMSGGGLGASFANLGGLASGSIGGFGAIGAALPAAGVVLAGAALLKKIFSKDPILTQEQYEAIKQAGELTGQSIGKLALELNDGATKLSPATLKIIKSIADLAGGIEDFGKKATFYAQNFLTQDEQQEIAVAQATKELNKQFGELNIAVPQTHAEYRKLVEAQDLATESGREMYAGLLNAAEAFVAVNGSAEAAAQGMAAIETSRAISDREKLYAERQAKRRSEGLTGRDAPVDTSDMSFFERASEVNKAFGDIYVNFLRDIKDQGEALSGMLGEIQGLNAAFASGNLGLTSFLEQANDFAIKTKEGFTQLAETTLRASTDIGLSAGGMAFSTETLSDFISGIQNRGAGAAQAMGQQFSQGGAGVSKAISEAYNFFTDLSNFVAGPISRAMEGLRGNLGTLRSTLSELKQSESMASEAIAMARENGQMVTEAQMGYYSDLTNNIGLTQQAAEVAMVEMARLKEVSVVIPEQAALLEAAVLTNLSGGVVNTGRMVQLVATYGANLGRQIAIALANAANAGISGVMSAFGKFGGLYSSGAINKSQYQSLTKEITGFLDVARSVGGGGGGGGGGQAAVNRMQELRKSFERLFKTVDKGIKSLLGLNEQQEITNQRRDSELKYLRGIEEVTEGNRDRVSEAVGVVSKLDEKQFGSYLDFMREATVSAAVLGNVRDLLNEYKPAGYANGGMHSGGMRIVGENGPELEVTGPSRIVPNGQLRSMMTDTGTKDEIRQLKDTMNGLLLQISKNTGKTERTLDRWNYEGLPSDRGF